MRCRFCWRIQSGDMDFKWDEMTLDQLDDPGAIVDGCMKA